MTVLRNEGRWDTSNADFRDGRVVRYEKGAMGMQWIDYGLSVLTPHVLGDEADLADVFRRLAASGRLAGYAASERFYEIGTPRGLAETEAFLSGRGGSEGS
jgi:NDP-sugar pyrophosphorylase family protein